MFAAATASAAAAPQILPFPGPTMAVVRENTHIAAVGGDQNAASGDQQNHGRRMGGGNSGGIRSDEGGLCGSSKPAFSGYRS